MPHNQKHVDFLDHIRGLAILGVFLVHTVAAVCGRSTLPWNTWHAGLSVSKDFLLALPFSYGWAGVSMFFVVSGFCIHLSYTQNPDWRSFFLRRFFRIYPPYFFAVLFFGLLVPWTRVGYTFLHQLFQFGTHLALVNNFHDKTFGGINSNFWSIAVEVQLYLLYPLLSLLVSRVGWNKSLAALAIMEFGTRGLVASYPTFTGLTADVWWQGLPVSHNWFLGFPLMYWFSWSIGAAIADAYVTGRPIPFVNQSVLVWAVVAFGSFLIKFLACFSFTFFALLTATVIAKLLRRDYFQSFPNIISKPLRLIGVLSYSLYLLHGPFLEHVPDWAASLRISEVPNSLVLLAMCLGMSIPVFALAALWYRIIELPSIALGKRFIRMISPRKLVA